MLLGSIPSILDIAVTDKHKETIKMRTYTVSTHPLNAVPAIQQHKERPIGSYPHDTSLVLRTCQRGHSERPSVPCSLIRPVVSLPVNGGDLRCCCWSCCWIQRGKPTNPPWMMPVLIVWRLFFAIPIVYHVPQQLSVGLATQSFARAARIPHRQS